MAEKTLKASDVMCPICISILVEPVTMPCSHSLCMPCFTQNVAQSALACPLCRLRISVWVRRATKSNKLINTKLWCTIKENFPEKVEARINDEDDVDSEDINTPVVRRVADPGEIRKEYEEMIAQQIQEISQRRSQEENASSSLLQKLQEEERELLRIQEEQKRQEEKDAAVAKEIREAEKKQLESELESLKNLCASDEAVAKEIEKTERKLREHTIKNKQTPQGPMDIYLGQLTPRTSGKKPLIKTSSKFDETYLNTPHTSTSNPGMEKSNILGRQLRELTASQSSESDCDGSYFELKYKHSLGKENRATKRRLQKKIENNTKLSPDIDSYSAGRMGRYIDSEDSDETDIEEVYEGVKIANKRVKKRMEQKENMMKIDKGVKKKIEPEEEDRMKIDKGVKKKRRMETEVEDRMKKKMKPEENRMKKKMELEDEDSLKQGNKQMKKNMEPEDNKGMKKNKKMELEEENRMKIDKGMKKMETEDENSSSEDNEDGKPTDGYLSENEIECLTKSLGEGESSSSLALLVAQQKRIEDQLRQEEQDRLLAQALQSEMDRERRVDRRKGSGDEYGLRKRTQNSGRLSKMSPKPSREAKKQQTLRESLQKRHQ